MELMKRIRRKVLYAACLAVCLTLAAGARAVEVTPAPAGAVVSGQAVEKSLAVGESLILDFQGLTRAAISDPAVADVVVLSTAQMIINGKAPGSTLLYVWDKKGRWTYRLSVSKAPSRIAALLPKINAEIGIPTVRAMLVNDVVVLEGTATSAAQAARAEAIAGIYAKEVKNLIEVQAAAPAPPKPKVSLQDVQAALGPGYKVRAITPDVFGIEGMVGTLPEDEEEGGGTGAAAAAAQKAESTVEQIAKALGVSIVWLPTPGRARQLIVRAKVVDIDKSALKDLGIDWGANQASGTGFTFFPNEMFFGESLTGPSEHAVNDGGPIRRLQFFGARLQALVTENKARILSEPNLLVKEGEIASILVGGEIPIPVVQAGGATAAAIRVEWKKFGVQLEIQGRIMDEGKSVDLMVKPKVSILDFGNAITVSGITLPALKSRQANTRVQMLNGQTLVIGGLFSSEDAKQIRKVPFLGDIPILGQFFKSRHNVRRESELMIFVTPEIVEQAVAGGGR
jgi:pilus assembly protein CpaC